MSLKDRINKISEYFRGIDYQGGLFIVKVAYPNKIEPKGSEDELIKVTFSEDDGLWYYYADAEIVNEDSIFDLIEDTIKTYEEAKKKIVLIKEKIEELREIFANNPLERLQTLYFGFNENVEIKKPKRQRRKKENKTENDVKNEVETC